MKKFAAFAVFPLVVALSGCDPDTEASGPTDPPEREVVTEVVTAEPEVVTVTAEAEVVTVTAEPEPAESEPETEEPESEAGGDFSSRGHLVKEIGEPAGILDLDTEESVVEFTLTEVEQNYQCTSTIADAPANGQYIALHFDVETMPGLTDSFSITDWEITLFDTEGMRENDSSGNAMWCADASQTLPTSMGPGQRASGVVVLDTALDTGVIVYEPMFSLTPLGWEWSF